MPLRHAGLLQLQKRRPPLPVQSRPVPAIYHNVRYLDSPGPAAAIVTPVTFGRILLVKMVGKLSFVWAGGRRVCGRRRRRGAARSALAGPKWALCQRGARPDTGLSLSRYIIVIFH